MAKIVAYYFRSFFFGKDEAVNARRHIVTATQRHDDTTTKALPWQLKDQKGHVLSLIYTLPWKVSTQPRESHKFASQMCLFQVAWLCITPFSMQNPLKVIGRARSKARANSQALEPEPEPESLGLRLSLVGMGSDGFISYFLWQHLRTICITKQTMRVVLFIGIQNLMPRPLLLHF